MESNIEDIQKSIADAIDEGGVSSRIILYWQEWSAVSKITVTGGGSGYASAPTVSFIGVCDVPATAVAVISGGAVTAINVTGNGKGYKAAPIVVLAGANTTPAMVAAALYEYDKINNCKIGVSVARTTTVNAFVHVVAIGTGSVRQFIEIETGDAILDFKPDVVLDGLEELRFMFAGSLWKLKPITDKLALSWDAFVGDRKLVRTVLVTKAT